MNHASTLIIIMASTPGDHPITVTVHSMDQRRRMRTLRAVTLTQIQALLFIFLLGSANGCLTRGSNSGIYRAGGGHWNQFLHFNPDAEKSRGIIYNFTQNDLEEGKLLDLLDPTEVVKYVYLYKLPLCERQLTYFYFFHQIIIFQTTNWWWSIEKDGGGLNIQRSITKDPVLRTIRRQRRLKGGYWDLELLDEYHSSGITLGKIIAWIQENQLLKLTYNVFDNNCKVFAVDAYNFLTKKSFTYFTSYYNYLFRYSFR